MESNLRKCPYCKKEKDYKQFRLVKSKLPRRGWIDKEKNQRWFQCKICEPLYKAEHYKKTDVTRRMLFTVKDRCRKKGVKCELTYDDINQKLKETNNKCPCCNREFDRKKVFEENGVKRNWLTHSLDRLDNKVRNYTKENTIIICLRCNQIKNAWNIKDLENVINFLKRNNSSK